MPDDTEVRPFRVDIPEDGRAGLRQQIAATPHLICVSEDGEGTHFAAWREPDLLRTEVGVAFRSAR